MWINLRNEINALIYGDARTLPQARWIVLRIMRIGDYSQYWNPSTNEAVGGPKWNYDDFIIRAISRPGASLSMGASRSLGTDKEDFLSGVDLTNKHVYAIAFSSELPRVPMIGDVVYEIDKYASIERPIPPLAAIDHMVVTYVHKITGDYGRSEGFLLLGERRQGDY